VVQIIPAHQTEGQKGIDPARLGKNRAPRPTRALIFDFNTVDNPTQVYNNVICGDKNDSGYPYHINRSSNVSYWRKAGNGMSVGF